MNYKLIRVVAGVIGCGIASQAATTVNTVHRHAYGANIGWINARGDVAHGASLGLLYATGYLWSANCGWIGLGNTPANGWHYSNTSSVDWGVNHDGAGNLSGYAYGANIGWVTFEQTRGKPRIDLLTGKLSGSVWSANVGWISLSNSVAHVQTDTLATGPDTDGDGIPDAWEYAQTGNLTTLAGASADWDQDGVPDVDEYGTGTDPRNYESRLAITAFTRTSGTDATTWTVEPTRLYRLQQSDSLTGTPVWVDSGLGTLLPGSGPVLTKQVAAPSATNRFYRVKAIVPLQP